MFFCYKHMKAQILGSKMENPRKASTLTETLLKGRHIYGERELLKVEFKI